MALGSKQMANVALTAAQVAATIGGITAPGMFSVQIAGTLTATITFELTIDGTNWVAVELHPTTDQINAGAMGKIRLGCTTVGKRRGSAI